MTFDFAQDLKVKPKCLIVSIMSSVHSLMSYSPGAVMIKSSTQFSVRLYNMYNSNRTGDKVIVNYLAVLK